jgi:hypothetical protein
LENNVKHYLTARDCDSKTYSYSETELGKATLFNIIPSVENPAVTFHIQSEGNLFNCPNSFLHYGVCETNMPVFGIAGAQYQEDSTELSADAGWFMTVSDDGEYKFAPEVNNDVCYMTDFLQP